MSFLQDVFPGWNVYEIATVFEHIFDGVVIFIAVFLVGLRDV